MKYYDLPQSRNKYASNVIFASQGFSDLSLYRRGADCKPLDSEDTKCLLYST